MKDNVGSENADTGLWTPHRSWRNRTAAYRRLGGLAFLAAATATALAACSASGSSSPRVASLGTTTSVGTSRGTDDGSTTTTVPKSSATALTDEWASCMRNNGDPNQAPPIIDSHGVINITVPRLPGPGASQAGGPFGAAHNVSGQCSQDLTAAQDVLRAEDPVPPFDPDQALLVQYVNCMRANGVPNYPYPTGKTTNFNGTGVDPNSPFVEKANDVCGKQIDAPAWWINGWGPPGDISVTAAGLNPNSPMSQCAYSKKNGCNASDGGGGLAPAPGSSASG
jgi:hypothetical protein